VPANKFKNSINMNIRNYKNEDFNAVLNLLNSNCEFDTFTFSLLSEKLYDDPSWNPNHAYVACENNKIIGFMLGVTRQIRGTAYGYIKLMAVNKQERRKGIATQLFNQLESALKKLKIDKLRIYDVPLNYYMPGIDPRYTEAICFAQKMGFSHWGDAVNMQVDLTLSDWDTQKQIKELASQQIEISRATLADKQELLDFISIEWKLWQYEILMAFKSNPISLFIAKQNNKIKAFSAYNGNNVGTGWFGPMGTHSDLRGKGMGSILLYLCLADMKNSGLTESTIPWVAPVSFYSHYAKAKISRVFWRFEKNLIND